MSVASNLSQFEGNIINTAPLAEAAADMSKNVLQAICVNIPTQMTVDMARVVREVIAPHLTVDIRPLLQSLIPPGPPFELVPHWLVEQLLAPGLDREDDASSKDVAPAHPYSPAQKDMACRADIAKTEVERLHNALEKGHITVEAIEGLDQMLADMPPGQRYLLISVKDVQDGRRGIETAAPVGTPRRLRSTKKRNLTTS